MRAAVILLLAVCSSLPGQSLSDPEVRDLEAAVQKLPNNYVGRYQLGRAYMTRGANDRAREELMKAIQLRSDYIPARLALAQLLLTRREYEQVLEEAAAIQQVDEENIPARLLRAAALTGLKRFEEARKLLDMLVAVNSASTDIWYQVGQLDFAENRYEDAEKSFRRAFEATPSNTRALLGMVNTFLVQNKTEEVLDLLRAEIEKRGNRKDLRLTLAETAVRVGKLDVAISQYRVLLEKAREDSPEAGDLQLRLGEVYRRQGDLKSSIEALSRARQLLPQNAAVASTLGLSLDLSGRKQEARLLYEEVVKMDPQNAAGLNNLAYLIADLGGDLDRALELAQRARELQPQTSEIADTVGFVHLKRNATDQALEIFRDLVSKEAKHSTYRYHLALALAQKGDRAAALRELDEAASLSSAVDEVLKIKELKQKLAGPE